MGSSDHPSDNQPTNKAAAEQQLAGGPAPGLTPPRAHPGQRKPSRTSLAIASASGSTGSCFGSNGIQTANGPTSRCLKSTRGYGGITR